MGVGLEWLERVAKQQERLKAQRKRIEENQRGRVKRIRGRSGWKTVSPQSLKQQKSPRVLSKWERRKAKWDKRKARWEARARKFTSKSK